MDFVYKDPAALNKALAQKLALFGNVVRTGSRVGDLAAAALQDVTGIYRTQPDEPDNPDFPDNPDKPTNPDTPDPGHDDHTTTTMEMTITIKMIPKNQTSPITRQKSHKSMTRIHKNLVILSAITNRLFGKGLTDMLNKQALNQLLTSCHKLAKTSVLLNWTWLP